MKQLEIVTRSEDLKIKIGLDSLVRLCSGFALMADFLLFSPDSYLEWKKVKGILRNENIFYKSKLRV